MGQDYDARKAAKKQSKKLGKQHDGVRKRSKKGMPNKRSGVCWGQPTLKDADRYDSSDNDAHLDAAEFDVLAGADIGRGDPQTQESRTAKRKRATVPLETSESKRNERTVLDSTDPDADTNRKGRWRRSQGATGNTQLSTHIGVLSDEAMADNAKPLPSKAMPEVSAELQQEHAVIRQYMQRQGFAEPTAVQRECWTPACAGHDILAQAPTGSGKTLAFLLPIAARLADHGHGANMKTAAPLALLLAPTRELAVQTLQAAKPLRLAAGLRAVCVHGGEAKDAQLARLATQAHLLVATPGRLLDLYDDGAVSFAAIQAVAIDECDKMLSLGFAAQLERLAALLLQEQAAKEPLIDDALTGSAAKRRKRQLTDLALVPVPAASAQTAGLPACRPQVLLFSATADGADSAAVDAWIGEDAVRISVQEGYAEQVSKTVTQVVQVCAEHKKLQKLLKHLQAIKQAAGGARALPRVLVFCNQIKTVNYVAFELKKAELKACCLHGECRQEKREEAVRAFKAGKAQVMVATDVAARGLHVRNLPYIVNYDFPTNMSTYVHRCGRTGRLQLHGHVLSFFTRNLAPLAPAVLALLQHHGQAVDPNLASLADALETVARKLDGQSVMQLLKQQEAAADSGAALDTKLEGEGAAAEDVAEGLRALQAHMRLNTGRRKKKAEPGQVPAQAADAEQVREAPVQPLAFQPSAKFAGPRPGYMFSNEKQGQGYYLDSPKRTQAPQPRRTTSQGQPATLPSSEAESRSRHRKSKAHEKREKSMPDAVTLNSRKRGGILGASKAEIDAAHLGSDSDSADHQEVLTRRAAADGAAKRKALPGRMRKKLARQAAAEA